MAKQALQHVLEQTIGKYVKNLDAESLNVAVWSGKIELHALELDVAAVNMELDRKAAEAPNLALPFKVVSGKFEAFQVEVPWSHLTSSPVVLRARGLTVQVEPYNRKAQAQHFYSNETMSIANAQKQRDTSIDHSNTYREQAYAVKKLAMSDPNSADHSTFRSRLVRRIIENIQIEISDVHISLSDDDGSAGLVLDSLSLVTTDKDGARTFVDRTDVKGSMKQIFLYKMLQIKGFGIYLDDKTARRDTRGLSSINENENSQQRDDLSHSYMLAPLSFQAKLRQADGNICIDYSKYLLSSELSAVSIMLSRTQLDIARKISREISSLDMGLAPLFPEYRPLARITQANAHEWWKYAFRCIGRLSGRSSWIEFFRGFKKRKAYIPLYKRLAHGATCSWIKELSPDEMSELSTIEYDRTIAIEGLMLWRDIADAQVDKERLKHEAHLRTKEQPSYFSSIFSSREKASDIIQGGDDPPIHLTGEEIKELEAMSKESFADEELSKDSKLYDVNFVLNALKINLTSYTSRPLATLDMGKVVVDFKAAADGAYGFNFDLFDLEIQDKATISSLFPSVLKSVKKNDSIVEGANPGAFHLQLSKAKTGDQNLQIKLAAFEAVASQILFKELRKFFSVSPTGTSNKGNPLLAQSLSGSVDLFYDADPGKELELLDPVSDGHITSHASSAYDFSSALVDAWKEKTESRVSWVMDVDINAPIIIVPESCNDPRASVLVLDLGHLQLQYGKFSPTQKIVRWFEENPAKHQTDVFFDSGTLAMNDLTFKVGTATDWRSVVDPIDAPIDESEVIEPISVKLSFGIEQNHNPLDPPRICCMGVIPSISLRFSPSQGKKFFPVIGAWRDFLDDLNDDAGSTVPISFVHDAVSVSSKQTEAPTHDVDEEYPKRSSSATDLNKIDTDYHAKFFFLIGLQRLSTIITLDENNRLEAHLVSVYASTTIRSNGSSASSFQMGWFWILDMLQNNFSRRQRLLAHSNLPQTPAAFAEGEKYNMLEHLMEQGVFDEEYAGSTELADITYQQIVSGLGAGEIEDNVGSILDAKFASLFIHWNPHAVKGVTAMIETFANVMNEHGDTGTFILSADTPFSPRKLSVQIEDQKSRDSEILSDAKLLVKAKMESLDIYLNSARDDLPLFVLTVARAQIDVLQSSECIECSLSLGDLRMTTPPNMGRTLPTYRTLLGLAPDLSESLLTVKYYQGKGAIDGLSLDSLKDRNLEAFADVVLSPMRLVFIQSQVMALVEYITEGIMGVLFVRAAATAAEAALEIANSVMGEKLFFIKATSFDLILPQAAYREEIFSANAGLLDIKYRMYPDTRSEVEVELSDVTLKDTKGDLMQDQPIRLSIDVLLPPADIGDTNDQAMKVDIDLSEASFSLSRKQYAQILHMQDENIAELELFLRGDESTQSVVTELDEQFTPSQQTADQTHAGVQVVDYVRNKYINVKVKILALQLCGSNSKDPLVRLAAVNTDIAVKSYYDRDEMVCQVSLHNLVCSDSRSKASRRQYRHLVDQGSQVSSDGPGDLFVVDYTAGIDYTRTELQIGSPQIVLIPDAISGVVSFFQVERRSTQVQKPAVVPDDIEPATLPPKEFVRVASNSGGEDFEASLVPGTDVSSSGLYTYTYSVKTKVCSIVLVDLGSQLSSDPISSKSDRVTQTTQLTETVVLQGIFDATLTMETDPVSFEIINARLESQADAMEIFSAFGKEMLSPLQILEPAQAAAHGSMKTNADGGTEVELRAAATTALEYSFSMHNAALLSAILYSLSESFASGNDARQNDVHIDELSKNEADRIEQLASALERTGSDRSLQHQNSSIAQQDDVSSHSSGELLAPPQVSRKIQLKVTMPELRVTVINDLQGLDDALFRVSVTNFVAGGELNIPSAEIGSQKMTVDFYLNTSILADYFDSSVNLWSKLLIMPWEITLKVTRSPSRRFKSPRLSSTIDLESFPCHISFSQEFIVSLASATRMWSIYSVATSKNSDGEESGGNQHDPDSSIKNSMAASAARNLLTSLPYAIENHCGDNTIFTLPGGNIDRRPCPHGSIQYFRFQPPQGSGYGGKKLYGQDVEFEKSVTLFFEDSVVVIPHLDAMLLSPRQAHDLPDGRVLVTYVVREGKTTVLHLTSNVSIFNHSSIPFALSIRTDGQRKEIGICVAHNEHKTNSALSTTDGVASKKSNSFSVPMDLLTACSAEWARTGQSSLFLCLSPRLPSDQFTEDLFGGLDIVPSLRELSKSHNKCHVSRFDVTCRVDPTVNARIDPLVVQVLLQSTLIDDKTVYIEVFLEPRAVIENIFPIGVKVRTPMPHIFSSAPKETVLGNDAIYDLKPGSRIEVFTPGPSMAVTFKPSDNPVAGSSLDWMDGGWIDLPLVSEFKLPEPLTCYFPFAESSNDVNLPHGARRNEFFIAEGYECLEQLSDGSEEEKPKGAPVPSKKPLSRALSLSDSLRTFFVTVCCYGVDHTGDILFEQVMGKQNLPDRGGGSRRNSMPTQPQNVHSPFGAFASVGDWRRLTLLPRTNSLVRLLQMTMEGDVGFRKTMPFLLEDLVIGEGGVDTTPILWENKKRSGYFAYRRIVNEHQSEIHVVPEFVVFNGSTDVVVVNEGGMEDIIIEPGKAVPLKSHSRLAGLELAFSFVQVGCRTKLVRVDQLGLKVEFVTSQAGARVGSVCVQTAIDALGDARLVVKIGEINSVGALKVGPASQKPGLLSDDFVRFRVRWTELQLVLNESQEKSSRQRFRRTQEVVSAIKRVSSPTKKKSSDTFEIIQQPLMCINFSRFTVDFQRVFKDPAGNPTNSKIASPERCQMSVIIHNLQVKDLTPDSPFPIVFDCSSDTNFFDLCLRTRGPLHADIVKVDLFDLNLAHAKGKSRSIQLTTSEEYVWRIIDLINRILVASSEVGGFSLVLKEDEDHGGFIVNIEDKRDVVQGNQLKYTPPKVDRLYDVDLARVSPFALLVSFRRNPDTSRYKKAQNVRGATLTNYFTRRLKFSIDNAELRFGRYENRGLKGPPDRLMESLAAVYASRMKFKIVTLLSAASFQDWKFLAARDNGDDEYVEGDILRATGNLAGRSANLVFKRAGQGIGDGVSNLTNRFGDGIEDVTGRIGARKVGAGFNSVLSGVGDGVGETFTGVGGGAGKIFKGAGQGIGHVVGGVTGGALLVGKGIGRGIFKGDGRAVIDGFGKGATQIGGGFAQGTESVVMGAADGVLTAGKGIFKGVKNVGMGFGNAFTGGKKRKDSDQR